MEAYSGICLGFVRQQCLLVFGHLVVEKTLCRGIVLDALTTVLSMSLGLRTRPNMLGCMSRVAVA